MAEDHLDFCRPGRGWQRPEWASVIHDGPVLEARDSHIGGDCRRMRTMYAVAFPTWASVSFVSPPLADIVGVLARGRMASGAGDKHMPGNEQG